MTLKYHSGTNKCQDEGRVVSTLEGGYSLTALAEAGAAHVRALFGLAD